MTSRETPLPPQTAAEILDRAEVMFAQADLYVRRALEDEAGADDPRIVRAAQIAQVAAAGAQVAQAMLAADDVAAAEEFDRHLGPYPTPLGHPPALPNATDNGYLNRLEAWRDDIADAAGIATDGFKAPEVAGPAAAEVRRLLGAIPYREDHRG